MMLNMRKPSKPNRPDANGKPKRAASRSKSRPPRDAPLPRNPDIPHWLCPHKQLADLPPNIRDAIPTADEPAEPEIGKLQTC